MAAYVGIRPIAYARVPQRGWTGRTAVTLGLLCGLASAHLLCRDLATERRYQQLAVQDAPAGKLPETGTPGIDWAALRSQNRDVAAWVSVGRTSIDYPVVDPSDDDMDFYLAHDFWGGDSPTGCPFLDYRCDADGQHVMVYGHHMGAAKSMFSELFDGHRQASFDGVGSLSWDTPDGGRESFEPLCALSVDSSWEPIQRFSFEGDDELRLWLAGICDQASARAAESTRLVARAQRVVTLVTCSSVVPGRQQRTLVLFVSPKGQPSQEALVLAGLPPVLLPAEP